MEFMSNLGIWFAIGAIVSAIGWEIETRWDPKGDEPGDHLPENIRKAALFIGFIFLSLVWPIYVGWLGVQGFRRLMK